MRIKELREKARKTLKGRWKDFLVIVLFMQVISLLFSVYSSSLKLESNVNAAIYLVVTIIYVIITLILGYSVIVSALPFIRKGTNIVSEERTDTIREEETNIASFLNNAVSNARKAIKLAIIYFWKSGKWLIFTTVLVVAATLILKDQGQLYAVVLVSFVLYIISGIIFIIKAFDYSLTYYLSADYPDKSMKEIFSKSKELMKGYKAKLAVLPLTFIGWQILSMIPYIICYVAVNFIIWEPVMYFSEIYTTAPVWASTLVELLTLLFIFVMTYMIMTTAHFYEEFNPKECFNDDYVKPENNSKKYNAILAIIIVVLIAVYILSAIVSLV